MARRNDDAANDKLIGARVKARRLMIGLSQTDLGRQLGITFQQVQKYEKGESSLSASRLIDVARILKCRPSDLLGDNGSYTSKLTDVAGTLLTNPEARDMLLSFNQMAMPARHNVLRLIQIIQNMLRGPPKTTILAIIAAAMIDAAINQ